MQSDRILEAENDPSALVPSSIDIETGSTGQRPPWWHYKRQLGRQLFIIGDPDLVRGELVVPMRADRSPIIQH